MIYNLIADAGSTKTDWVLTDGIGEETARFRTPGLNAMLASDNEISRNMHEVYAHLPSGYEIVNVSYYGAGCATTEVCRKIEESLRRHLGAQNAEVCSDLLGAARSLLGGRRGIACILGTGSNSCEYDGKRIVKNVPALGYVLGDEGSGAVLGRRFVSDAFKGLLPARVAEEFLAEYGLSLGDVLARVYRQAAPNRFLASLTPFIKRHLDCPEVAGCVEEEFDRFFERNILRYPSASENGIYVTGGIGYHFRALFERSGDRHGIRVNEITENPLDGLVRYHRS